MKILLRSLCFFLSFLAIPVDAQDMSGWSDDRVCQHQGGFNEEVYSRGLNCKALTAPTIGNAFTKTDSHKESLISGVNKILYDGIYSFSWTYLKKNKGISNREKLATDIIELKEGKFRYLSLPCSNSLNGKYRMGLKLKFLNNYKRLLIDGNINVWGDTDNSRVRFMFDDSTVDNDSEKNYSIRTKSRYGNYEDETIGLRISKYNEKSFDEFICNPEKVSFNSYSVKSAKDLVGGLKKRNNKKVYGDLYMPKGNQSDIPVVITIHPSSGRVPAKYFKFFNDLGVAVLDLQPFRSRGITDQFEYIVSEESATIDAFMALDRLSTDKRFDPKKILIMGFSYGAMVAINVHQKFFIDAIKPKNRFAAHIAYYPWCSLYKSIKTTQSPLYILIGGKDRLTPQEYCADYTQKVIESGGKAVLHVFPKAYHRYDWEVLNPGIFVEVNSKVSDEFLQMTLSPSYPRYEIGEEVFDLTAPNGWSYFSLASKNEQKEYYKSCCEKHSTLKYNKNATVKSNSILKEIIAGFK